jgi:hypothetical protein
MGLWPLAKPLQDWPESRFAAFSVKKQSVSRRHSVQLPDAHFGLDPVASANSHQTDGCSPPRQKIQIFALRING